MEAAYYFPSAEPIISCQQHPQQPVLLQSGDGLLIYRNHCLLLPSPRCLDELHLKGSHPASHASATWVRASATWYCLCAVSADGNRGLWLLQAPPIFLCHAAAPLRSVKILLLTFFASFGESLSVRLIATIPPPLFCHHDADGWGRKHLCVCNIQLQLIQPQSENPDSKSSRTLLASAQHGCMASHVRHFAPQITPMKITQCAG